MAKSQENQTISIVIPTINEAKKLPLLLADIKKWAHSHDIIVIDGGSKDLTLLTTDLAGVDSIRTKEANRGNQLKIGASKAMRQWLLFLHADCRLNRECVEKVEAIIHNSKSKNYAWYFDFKINSNSLSLKILEKAVALRNLIFKTPYGDQGLLIHKDLYIQSGGYKSLKIMEDLDLILRLHKLSAPKRIGTALTTDSRKWKHENIIKRAFKNARLRRLWKLGVNDNELFKHYYS